MVWCRKLAREEARNLEQIEQLMDATHEVSKQLLDWGRHDIGEIRTHFGCYQALKWKGPDLVERFDELLSISQDEAT